MKIHKVILTLECPQEHYNTIKKELGAGSDQEFDDVVTQMIIGDSQELRNKGVNVTIAIIHPE